MINKRYIVIDSCDITKKYTKENQEYEDNILTSEIFEKYNIPEEYRKIIIRNCLYTLPNSNKNFYELTTNIVLKVDIIKKLKNNEYLMGGYFDNNSHTEVNTIIKGYDPKDVKEFYQEIIDLSLAKEYSMAIKEILSNKLEIINKSYIKRKSKKNNL
ncbi:MAG: hypothetical protein IJZ79_06325 [Bacilli bacterium]|nr:hypothetical protein [Bacilli bacterium]